MDDKGDVKNHACKPGGNDVKDISWDMWVKVDWEPKARQGGAKGPWLSQPVGQLPTVEDPGLIPWGPPVVAQHPGCSLHPRMDPSPVRALRRPETRQQARDLASDACAGGCVTLTKRWRTVQH